MDSLTTIMQSIALTITPRGHPLPGIIFFKMRGWMYIPLFSVFNSKAKIDSMQQNVKCRLGGQSHNKWMQQTCAKEYKTRHDWVEKVINWELCKKLLFNDTTKWYMHKPDSILENEMDKILGDFQIQTDPLIPGRRPDLTRKKELTT